MFPMKDGEMRGLILEKFYDRRNTGNLVELTELIAVAPDCPVQVTNVCDQLHEYGLISWRPIKSVGSVVGGGLGRITAKGVDVIDGTTPPPLTITLHDHRVSISGSSHVQVGSGNVQGLNIDIERLSLAIDHSNATMGEKKEAKSLLEKVVGNKVLWTVLGACLAPGSAH
jgi:hypothetical protein